MEDSRLSINTVLGSEAESRVGMGTSRRTERNRADLRAFQPLSGAGGSCVACGHRAVFGTVKCRWLGNARGCVCVCVFGVVGGSLEGWCGPIVYYYYLGH